MITNSTRLQREIVEKLKSGLGQLGLDVRRARSHPFRPRHLEVEPKVVLDVGAADGTPELYTAYPDARIVVIEPLAEQIERLRPQLAGRDVEYLNVAVGSATGEADLLVDGNNLLKSSFQGRTALTASTDHPQARTVAITRLDDLVARNDWPVPYALKIDVEGLELDVLRGATETLRRSVVVHCETSVAARFEGGYRFRDIAELLINSGFDMVDLTDVPRGSDGRTVYADCVWVRIPD